MRRSLLALLVSSCIAVAALAELPDFARGVSPGKSYHIFDVDTINNYNGNLVLRIPLGAGVPVGPFLTQNLILTYNSKLYDYQFLDFDDRRTDSSAFKRRAIPEDYSNAGLGWTVGLGRLLSPEQGTPTTAAAGWRYRAADGAEHELIPPSPSADPVEARSFDSSFLRMRRYPATDTVQYREIEFPDGTIHKFNPSGLVTEIRDRAGYWVRVDYSDAMKWVIANGFNATPMLRTTTIKFVARVSPDATYAYGANFAKVIESIELPAFGGKTATISFSYTDTTLEYDGCGDEIDDDPLRFGAPLLQTLTLPDNSSYSFTYDDDNAEACTAGMVKTMTLPTGGTIQWKHGTYDMPQADCQDDYGWVAASPGVRSRILKAGATTLGEWTYTPRVDLNPGTDVACGAQDGQNKPYGPPPTQLANEVVPPAGGKIIHYFESISGFPGAPKKTWPTNPARRLSMEQFDDDDVQRSTYLTYSYPTGPSLGNPTVMGETTVYDSDTGCGGACYVDVDRPVADYAGFGHFRKTVTTSNFGPTRTAFTNYTPDEANWILNKYDFSWVEENGVTTRQQARFDANGILLWRRTLAGTGPTNDDIVPQATDLLAVVCRETTGYVKAEKFLFAGERDAGTDDHCTATPGVNEYQIDHVWTTSNGVPTTHTAQYNGTTTYITDEDLDANTGFVSKSRDTAKVPTVFDYDTMGRLLREEPTGRAWTVYEYPTAKEVKVFRKKQDGTTVLKSARFEFDDFGRLVHEYLDMPDGAESRRDTTWNIVGWKMSVSELGDVNTPSLPITESTYDAFGRPKTVTAPDGSTTDFDYTGVRVNKRTTKVATAPSTNTSVATTETYDAHGRLIAVEEPSGAPAAGALIGAQITTSYTYDGANRLRTVTTDAQQRDFTYDGRGFLTKEDHPEANAASYTHDARGKVLTKTVEGGSAFDLTFEYDKAERLTFVKGRDPVTPSSFRVLKEFRFGGANVGENLRAGKLSHAIRFNYPPVNDPASIIRVTEEYGYDDTAGRRTSRKTSIEEVASAATATGVPVVEPIGQRVSYDDLDLDFQVVYPKCTGCGASVFSGSRTVTFVYDQGRITSIPGFVTSTTYHSNGMWKERVHANNVTDKQELADEPSKVMARPRRLAVSGMTSCPTITVHPQDADVRSGGTAPLIVAASGAQGATYTLYEGIRGDRMRVIATNTTGMFTSPPVHTPTSFWCEVSLPGACSAQSLTAHVSVCSDVAISDPPVDAAHFDELQKTELSFSVAATGANLSYRWEAHQDGSGIAPTVIGITASAIWTPPTEGLWTISVIVTGRCGGIESSVKRIVRKINVVEPAPCTPRLLNGFPKMLRILSSRPRVEFDILLDVPGWPDLEVRRAYTFTWMVDGTVVHDNVAGASRFSVLVGDGKTVKLIVRGKCNNADFSITRETFVFHPDLCPVPRISVDQLEVTPDTPSKAFTVSSPWPSLTYQWYRGDSGNTRYPVKQGPTLVVSTTHPATYWVRATSSCGNHNDSPTLTVSSATCSPLRIVKQPEPGEIAAGAPHTLSFEATTGTDVKGVTWYAGYDEATSTVVGAGKSYVAQPRQTTAYWARIETLGCGSYDTTVATVRVTSCDAISVDAAPPAAVTFEKNQSTPARLTIAATSQHPLQYEWFEGEPGDTRKPKGVGQELWLDNPGVSTRIWVRVRAGDTCSVDRVIDVTVCEPFGIVLDPFGAVSESKFVRWIGVDASGSSLTYQWFIKNENDSLTPLAGEKAQEALVSPELTTRYVARVTTSCGTVKSIDSKPALISVPPVLTSQIAGGPATKGSTRELIASANGTYLKWQWFKGPDDTQPVAGATSEKFTPTLTADVTYWARVWSGEAYRDTASAAFTICQPRGIVSNNATQVSGKQVLLTVQLRGENELFEWYEGESGDTRKLLDTGGSLTVSPTVTTKYWLRTKRPGCDADSETFVVVVCYPSIDTQPAPAMANPNGPAYLSVAATGHPSMTYQWYEGQRSDTSKPVPNGNAREVTTPALNAPTWFWVRISNPASQSCANTSVDSLATQVTICDPPKMTSDPVDMIKSGASVKLTAGATGTEVKYQWFQVNGTNGILLQNETSNTLIAGPPETTNYILQVTGRCGQIYSRIAKVSVAPVITTPPADAQITKGTATVLTVAASGTERTYQWYDAAGPIAGKTAETFTTPVLQANATYWVRVFSGQAHVDSTPATVSICQPRRALLSQASQETASPVYLEVEAPAAGETYEWYEINASGTSVSIGTGNRITRYPETTTQYWVRTKRSTCDADSAPVTALVCRPKIAVPPANTSAIAGQHADFAVSASGPGPLSYQWYRGASGDTANPLPNETAATLRVWPSTTTHYWVRVSSPARTGCAITFANSAAALVTVCNPVSITADPVNENATHLQNVTLSVTASGTVTSYQWYEGRKGVTTKPVGTNSRQLTVSATGTKYYWVRVNGACGTDDSEEALVSVIPEFTASPVDASACSGKNATFTAAAKGDPATITYQWYSQLTGSATAQVVGTNSPTLTIAATAEMSVWCVATSGNSSTSSACATLSVSPNPLISRTQVVRMANGAYYLLYVYIPEEDRPDSQYAWYAGQIGNTTTQIGWSDNTSVSPSSRPAHYWVRVTNLNTGCYTDTAVVVQ